MALGVAAVVAYWPIGLGSAVAWTLAAVLLIRRSYPRFRPLTEVEKGVAWTILSGARVSELDVLGEQL